MEEIYR